MQFAVDNALRLGIAGYVKKYPTGTIHIAAESEEKKLNEFLKLCRERREWEPENENIILNDKIIGYKRFYIQKQG